MEIRKLISEIDKLKSKLVDAEIVVSKLYKEIRDKEDILQKDCPHPQEWIEFYVNPAPSDEPLCADGYTMTCTFCNKRLDQGYIGTNPSGKFSYGKYEYAKGYRHI